MRVTSDCLNDLINQGTHKQQNPDCYLLVYVFTCVQGRSFCNFVVRTCWIMQPIYIKVSGACGLEMSKHVFNNCPQTHATNLGRKSPGLSRAKCGFSHVCVSVPRPRGLARCAHLHHIQVCHISAITRARRGSRPPVFDAALRGRIVASYHYSREALAGGNS